MDKEKRKKGENYLKNWGKQIEINRIKKNNDVFATIQIENKDEIVNVYNNIINEKLLNLKQKIYEYKLVDDIINSLEDYQKDIIRFRYIYKNSWQAIALKAHISVRQCFNIKNLVINKILKDI
mgnify:CR=1 FL=1